MAIEILRSIFAFALCIGVIVTLHELGHYGAARCFGLIGTKFSIGMGKRLWGWRDKRGTEWIIAPFLIGGYVQFPGDSKKDVLQPGQKTLKSLKLWQRAIVVAAGPVVNLVLASLIFAFIAGVWGYPAGRPVIERVIAGSPAAYAGLQAGDRITYVNDHRVLVAADIPLQVGLVPNHTISIEFERQGELRQVRAKIGSTIVSDGNGNSAQIGYLGVELPQAFQRAHNPVEALTQGVRDGYVMTYAQLISIKQIATGERSIKELSGPIRIAKNAGATISMGVLPFIYFMAIISIAVGVMNFMPIPGLDGGHLATYAIEGISRRAIPEHISQRIAIAGFCLVGCLGILGLTLDIVSLT